MLFLYPKKQNVLYSRFSGLMIIGYVQLRASNGKVDYVFNGVYWEENKGVL